MSEVEACFAGSDDFERCDTASDLGDTGLALGGGKGDVRVSPSSTDTYTVGRGRGREPLPRPPAGRR